VTPLDPIPSSLEEALNRLAPSHRIQSAHAKLCALQSKCPQCLSRGMALENDGVFIKATLCRCVMGCQVCAGTCLKPVTADKAGGFHQIQYAPCSSPSATMLVGLMNDAKIPGRYLEASLKEFSNFSGSGKTVIAQMARWIDNFKPGKSSGLVLSGSVGVGKTYLLAAIAKELVFKGYSVRFADFFQLLNELRDAYSSESAKDSSLRPLNDYDVLLIDELGKGRNSEWELSVADTLISERYNGNKCLIASTNYSLKDQQSSEGMGKDFWGQSPTSQQNQMNTDAFESLQRRLGPRIYSRLKEMAVFLELTGNDFRRS
jgi:DNA replication protein DnaC